MTSASELNAALERQALLGPTTPFPLVKPFATSLHAGKPPEPPHKPSEPFQPPHTGIVPAEHSDLLWPPRRLLWQISCQRGRQC